MLDYQIGFFTLGGFAEAIEKPGSSLHGVVHHLDNRDMEKLDKIEQLYDRRMGTAIISDGTTRQVSVYVQSADAKEMKKGLPKERYLEIMTDGCRHYGVDAKYIEFLERHESVPRLTPDQYTSFPSMQDCDQTMKLEQVFENNGAMANRSTLH